MLHNSLPWLDSVIDASRAALNGAMSVWRFVSSDALPLPATSFCGSFGFSPGLRCCERICASPRPLPISGGLLLFETWSERKLVNNQKWRCFCNLKWFVANNGFFMLTMHARKADKRLFEHHSILRIWLKKKFMKNFTAFYYKFLSLDLTTSWQESKKWKGIVKN